MALPREEKDKDVLLERKKEEISRVLGDFFFLYEDDKAFIIQDAVKWDEIKRALKNNISKIVWKRFEQTATKKMNVIMTVFGPPGTGKSIAGLSLACILQYMYLKQGKPSKIYICFSDWEVNDILKKANPGDIILQDERPVIHGAGSRITLDSINNIRKAVRAKQINYIGITPNEMQDLVVNLKFETLGYNEETGLSRMLVRGGRNNTILGICYIKKGIPEDLLKKYEDMKMKNIDDLLEAGGMVAMDGKKEAEKLLEDTERVLRYIKENKIPIDTKKKNVSSEIRPFVSLAGIDSPSAQYTKNLLQYISIKIRMGALSEPLEEELPREDFSQESEKEEKLTGGERVVNLEPVEEHYNKFFFDMSKAFKRVRGKDKEDKILQFQLAYSGKTTEEIYDAFSKKGDIDSEEISLKKIEKNIRSVLIVVRKELGRQWESYCAKKYEQDEDVEKVYRAKDRRLDPDLVVKYKSGLYAVINTKASAINITNFKIRPKEFMPEIRKARELAAKKHEVKLLIHYYNTYWKYETIVETSYKDPEKVSIEIPAEIIS